MTHTTHKKTYTKKSNMTEKTTVFIPLTLFLLVTYLPRYFMYKRLYKKLEIKPTGILGLKVISAYFIIALIFLMILVNLFSFSADFFDLFLGVGVVYDIIIPALVLMTAVFVNIPCPWLLSVKCDIPSHMPVPSEILTNIISYIIFFLFGFPLLFWLAGYS